MLLACSRKDGPGSFLVNDDNDNMNEKDELRLRVDTCIRTIDGTLVS